LNFPLFGLDNSVELLNGFLHFAVVDPNLIGFVDHLLYNGGIDGLVFLLALVVGLHNILESGDGFVEGLNF
jgi:hypothetical protein